MRSAKKPKSKGTMIALVSAIIAVQVAIYFVVTGGDSKPKTPTPEAVATAGAELSESAAAPENPDEVTDDMAALEEGIDAGSADGVADLTADGTDGAEPGETVADGETETGLVADGETAGDTDTGDGDTDTGDGDTDSGDTNAANITASKTKASPTWRKNRRRQATKTRTPTKVAVAPVVEKKEEVKPPPATTIDITSVPSGATIALDGVFIGNTPIRGVAVTPGRHSVAASRTGFDPKVVQIRASLGSTQTVPVRMSKTVVAVAPKQPTRDAEPAKGSAVMTRAARTPRVSASAQGSASQGKGILGSACNRCHSQRGTSNVAGKRYTSSQWDRFFASGSHDRYERIGGKVSSSQLSHVKAYLKSKAAGSSRNQGAGIRE